jgi:hypothetical protein
MTSRENIEAMRSQLNPLKYVTLFVLNAKKPKMYMKKFINKSIPFLMSNN